MKKTMKVWLNSFANDCVKGAIYGIMTCYKDDPKAEWAYALNTYQIGPFERTLMKVDGEESNLIKAKELIECHYGKLFIVHIDITDSNE